MQSTINYNLIIYNNNIVATFAKLCHTQQLNIDPPQRSTARKQMKAILYSQQPHGRALHHTIAEHATKITYVLLQSFGVTRSGRFQSHPSEKVANVTHDDEESVADVREYGLKQRRFLKALFGLILELFSHFIRLALLFYRCLTHWLYRLRSRSTDRHFFLVVLCVS